MVTKTNGQRARSIYGVVFGLFTLFVGFLLIKQVWSIYFSADSKPFSTESISAHFKHIQVFIWVWLVGLFIGAVWGIFVPDAKKKSGYVDYSAQGKKLKARLPDGGRYLLRKQNTRVFRMIIWGFCAVIFLIGAAVCAYYLGDTYQPEMQSAFFAESNGAAERLLKILPWLTTVLFVFVGAAVLDTFILASENSILKTYIAREAKWKKKGNFTVVQDGLLARGDLEEYERICAEVSVRRAKEKASKKDAKREKRENIAVWIARGVLACVAVTFIIIGIYNGGMTDIFEKARNICTQCIGLG